MFTASLIVTAILAAANWWSRRTANQRLEEATKPLTTIGALVVALSSGASGGLISIATVALVLCLAGDLALLDRFDRFVVGLGAFLLAHLTFLVLFAAAGLDSARLAGLGLIVLAVIAAGTAPSIFRGARRQRLLGPVRAYNLVIAAMAVFGWSTGNWLWIVGVTAFVVSDTILGWGKFVGQRTWMPVAVMVTYHIAIVGLAAGLHLASRT